MNDHDGHVDNLARKVTTLSVAFTIVTPSPFVRRDYTQIVACSSESLCTVTFALKAGINTKVASEGLGNSKVGITRDLYQHVLRNMQNDMSDAVSSILRREV